MLNKLKYIIITIIFLLISFVFGSKTIINNIRPIATQTLLPLDETNDLSILDKLTSKFEIFRDNTNKAYNSNLSGRKVFIEAYGATQLLLNKRLISDSSVGYVLKDNNNFLHFAGYLVDTKKNAQQLINFNNYLQSLDIPFVFVSALSKNIEGYTEFKNGLDIYSKSNTNVNVFFNELKSNNINYLNLNTLDTGELNKEELFFKTDHHWKTETAFWAYTEIVDYLDYKLKIKLDKDRYFTNIDNYDTHILKESFLGSLGKRMGRIYSGIDDYTYITPKFDTYFKISLGYQNNLVKEGKFNDSIIDKTLSDINEPIETNRYGTYFSQDNSFETIENINAKNDYKILLIKDSYALPVASFLSLSCKKVTMVDLRLVKNESVKEYIENGDYDIVIMLYGSGSISSYNMFDIK
ncbi:hypothetical protein JYG23_01540 [Sedimentibacter sp. zth1]|uniref:DHHW family protein n=1 Tax=Sedimentibacter sp. zth1 TaxID=2816908 RepID=UPI001A9303EB|nr:DHHW family protein [Sedimentibacter sp. zth1]QSX06175.1 hypothetical protein JYG23_01540 [Sedimentibacter sp. zth1]